MNPRHRHRHLSPLISPIKQRGKKPKEMPSQSLLPRRRISLLLSLIMLLLLLILFYINISILSSVQSREGRSSPVNFDPDILPLTSTNNNNNINNNINKNTNNTVPTIKEMRVDDLYQYALFKSAKVRNEKDARKLRHFLSTHPQPKWDKKKA